MLERTQWNESSWLLHNVCGEGTEECWRPPCVVPPVGWSGLRPARGAGSGLAALVVHLDQLAAAACGGVGWGEG